jgi:hypothetical protein
MEISKFSVQGSGFRIKKEVRSQNVESGDWMIVRLKD